MAPNGCHQFQLRRLAKVIPDRKGDWMETYTGVQFWPLDPRPEDVRIEDIAHALSQVCRFTGHTLYFFSVAQHSLNCMEFAKHAHGSRTQLHALLHDAAETYLCDLARPVKLFMPEYKKLEQQLELVIFEGLGLVPPGPNLNSVVKWIDNVMLATEGKELMRYHGWRDEGVSSTGLVSIVERPMKDVETDFLTSYAQLKECLRSSNSLNQE
jgi:hypothetical protein